MINTQTQIDSLIDLAVIQRTELKQLVESLPQLRDHLSSEIERNLEEIEPAIRSELEQFVAARALDTQAKTSAELGAKLDAMARNLESTTAAKYSVLMAERAQNATLLAQAEARIAEAASALPGAVKGIVTDELARFPRAGEIDQLRKEFAEPRGLNPRGRWQVGDTYNKLDLVSYNGDSYVSNTDGNREKPSRSSEAWTLSAARGNSGGGGGATSLTDLVPVPANGELLIGNGSAFVNNTLTAGTGVTITNGPGSITIDASGAQELLTATVTNAESFAITRGQVVYLFGATGNRASVKLADNSADATSSKTFGVVSDASISANGVGLITCVGVVDGLSLGAYSAGDVLYLGNTPGSVTVTKPYAPNHLVYVGIVERANNGNGELYVRIQNGFELDEIHDVQITTPPLAGALLMRDATNSLWKANRLTGTANQVTVTNADTAVTLSLPTAIANVNSVTAQSATNLTLAGGSTGASLVLGQGATAADITLTPKGSGEFKWTGSTFRQTAVSPNSTGYIIPGYATGTNPDAGSSRGAVIDLINLSATDQNGAALTFSNSNQLSSAYIFGQNLSHAGRTGNIIFGTANAAAPTERMRINSTGNLLIGTTTDISGTGGLHVAGTGTATSSSNGGALRVGTNVAMSGNAGGASYFGGRIDSSATGSAAAPVFSNGSSGIYFSATNGTMVFSATGSQTMTLNSGSVTTNGAHNITSTSPSTGAGSGALQVAGGIYSGAASVFGSSIGIGGAPYFSAKLTVDGNVIVAGSLGVAGARGGPITNIYNDGGTASTSKAFQIGNSSGTTLATFEYGGNVGIGTTTPATKLDVNGAATFAGAVSVGGTISQPTASAGQNNLQTLAANSGFWNNMNNNSNAGRFIYGVEGAAGATFTGSTANAAFAGSNAVNAFHLLANGAIAATVATTAIFVANTTAAPGSNPTGGGYLYVESGALKYRGSSGTVTTIANA